MPCKTGYRKYSELDKLRREGDLIRQKEKGDRLKAFRRRIELEVENLAQELDQGERNALVEYLVEVEKSSDKEASINQFDRLPADYVASEIDKLWRSRDKEEATNIGTIGAADAIAEGLQDSSHSRFMYSISFDEPTAALEDWGFHMTSDFRKSVKDLDKSMRGRVLDAITEICQYPMVVRGDTVKPLVGKLSGCWRYRLGDYRLIYQPIKNIHRIDLISIGGRGSVYFHGPSDFCMG